jgi:hypothetical protein
MPTDRYIKAVLTVIAGALLYLCAMQSGPPASAQGMGAATPGSMRDDRPQRVVVVGWELPPQQPVAVAIQPGAQPLPVSLGATAQQPLPVSLGVTAQRPLPVAVTGIKAGADWDEIRAKVEQPLTGLPGKP